ncbi:MAG: hypothetical protein SGILL_002776 [Bacillariaceae sp.]
MSHDHECLVEIEPEQLPPFPRNVPLSEEVKAMNDEIDCSDGSSLQGVQIIGRGTEVRGYVAPSTKQRQLMRKVSGLGMEDPVFSALAAKQRPKRNPNIFDDMDLDDVPEDMRDMFSVASDGTDSIELHDDILESPSATVRAGP